MGNVARVNVSKSFEYLCNYLGSYCFSDALILHNDIKKLLTLKVLGDYVPLLFGLKIFKDFEDVWMV